MWFDWKMSKRVVNLRSKWLLVKIRQVTSVRDRETDRKGKRKERWIER